jgi:hypothetical protein
MVRNLTCVLLLLVAFGSSVSSQNPEPKPDPVLGSYISKVLYHDGRIWLLGGMNYSTDRHGGVVSFDLGGNARHTALESDIVSLTKAGEKLWALRRHKKQTYALLELRKGRFHELGRYLLKLNENPAVLISRNQQPLLLTDKYLRLAPKGERDGDLLPLQGILRSSSYVTSTALLHDRWLYIGFDIGEWGGGLQRIDLDTGTIDDIERRNNDGICSGPLNKNCDPVAGIIPNSDNAHCVMVSTGLAHLSIVKGAILRVCGETVFTLWPQSVIEGSLQSPTGTVDQLALASDGGFWALTSEAIHRFTATGELKQSFKIPKLRKHAGTYFSDAIQGLLVFSAEPEITGLSRRYHPLLLPLDGEVRK